MRASTATTAKELPRKKKFATKQARNRERNRVKKLSKKQPRGYKSPRRDIVSPAMLELAARGTRRLRADEIREENDRLASRRQSLAMAQRVEKARADQSRQLYRETKAERLPIIRERDAKILADVKRTVEAADARAYDLRHRGRPKSAKRLPPLAVKRNPDALLAAVPQWQGER